MSTNVWEIMERMQGAIAAEIRVMLGESAYAQSMFDETQRKRRIEAMRQAKAQPGLIEAPAGSVESA